ncbi:NUDIX hydrolase [Pontibacter ruber]|uniref:8-oxo-dGTP diphosphatase n=1 Tax=Pontibacter ruber TaxID=1343895 RepID=A0ABW5CUJ2_9BACT|nr:NUDIX domain-containing protein [Pontibacter ruber]
MKWIDKLAWLELQDGKILSTRSKGKDTYYIPGGKREGNETDSEALVREIREELNIELEPASLTYVGTFRAQAHGHAAGIEVCMTCYSGTYKGNMVASSEIEEFVWLSYAHRQQVSEVDKLIFDWLYQQGLLR